jgi:hypothetical protein
LVLLRGLALLLVRKWNNAARFRVGGAMTWTVKPVRSTPSLETPAALRRMAAEFLRIAAAEQDAWVVEECHQLAAAYLARASELEAAASMAIGMPPEAGRFAP